MMKPTRILILLLAHLALTCLAMPAFDDSPYPPLDDVTSPPGVASDDGNLYEDYDFDAEPEPGKYKCDKTWLYVEYSRLCDGLQDCDHADDEDPLVCEVFGQVAQMSSSTTSQPPTTTTDASTTTSSSPSVDGFDLSIHDYSDVVCADDEFQCSADPGICLPASAACDGESDCSDAEDELFCAPILVHPDLLPTPHNHPEPPTSRISMKSSMKMKSRDAVDRHDDGEEDVYPDLIFRRPHSLPHPAPSSTTSESTTSSSTTTTFPNGIIRIRPRSTLPPPIQMEEEEQEEDENAGLELVQKYITMPTEEEEEKTKRVFFGESGETNAEEHYPNFQSLTDEEAEKMMNNALEQEIRTIPATSASSSSSSNALPSKSSLHKARVRGLMGQLIKQMGKLIATDLGSRDVDLNLKISGARTEDGRTPNGEPRMTLSLQIDV